jgi:hypothetical protein
MKLKITSTDLTRENTRIINADTGELLERVSRVEIVLNENSRGTVTLVFSEMDIDINASEENLTCREENDLVRKGA